MKNDKVLDLAKKLEPDQFVGLVLLYAHRIGDRNGVRRAYGFLTAPSSPYRQRLKAYRDSHVGGLEKSARTGEKLRKRDQEILDRANELLKKEQPRRNIASILAKEFALTPARIRQILKKQKFW